MKVTKLKTKRNRTGSYTREIVDSCPYCSSIMKLDVSGKWYCTENNLKYWIIEIKKYLKMSNLNKKKYLDNIIDLDSFFIYVERHNNNLKLCDFYYE